MDPENFRQSGIRRLEELKNTSGIESLKPIYNYINSQFAFIWSTHGGPQKAHKATVIKTAGIQLHIIELGESMIY